MGSRRRGVAGLKPLTKDQAADIPGLREWLASPEGKRSKRKTVGWDVVGGYLWKWWLNQEAMREAIRADERARVKSELIAKGPTAVADLLKQLLPPAS